MDLEKRTEIPNSLEEHWMPFTSNRDYKNSPWTIFIVSIRCKWHPMFF